MHDAIPLLRDIFGFDDFRPGQEEIVEAVSAGRIDNRRFTSLMGQITAEVMAVAGEHEAALDVLERIAGGVLIDVVWLRRYPHFAPLRDRPRFRAALDEVAARARSMWQRS